MQPFPGVGSSTFCVVRFLPTCPWLLSIHLCFFEDPTRLNMHQRREKKKLYNQGASRSFFSRCEHPKHHSHPHLSFPNLRPHLPTSFPVPHLAITMTKDEVMLDDKFDDKKFDCQDVEKLDLQEDDDSPIEEVRVTVPSEYQTSFLIISPLLSTRLYFDTPSPQLSTSNLSSSPTLPLVSFIHLLHPPPRSSTSFQQNTHTPSPNHQLANNTMTPHLSFTRYHTCSLAS